MTQFSPDPVYEGRSLSGWIQQLQSPAASERCTAALALGEIGPERQEASNALARAMLDEDQAVQVAAGIALGFIQMTPQARRNMLDDLRNENERVRNGAVELLRWTPSPDQAAATGNAAPPPDYSAPTDVGPSYAAPDRVHGARGYVGKPGGLSFGGLGVAALVLAALGAGTGWAAAELAYWRWIMIGLAALGLAVLVYAAYQKSHHLMRPADARRLSLLGGGGLVVGVTGGVVCLMFARAAVYVENDTRDSVWLLVNDGKWVQVNAGQRLRQSLTRGAYRVEVQAQDGKKLDDFPIAVADCGNYILNVAGAHTYYMGSVTYGAVGLPPTVREVHDKWFEANVYHLFEVPPQTITISRRRGDPASAVTRTFLLRDRPPFLQQAPPPVPGGAFPPPPPGGVFPPPPRGGPGGAFPPPGGAFPPPGGKKR